MCSISGGIEILTDTVNEFGRQLIDDDVVICCEDCRDEMPENRNRDTCPACGGHPVGIRLSRNHLTGKILFAERVEQ